MDHVRKRVVVNTTTLSSSDSEVPAKVAQAFASLPKTSWFEVEETERRGNHFWIQRPSKQVVGSRQWGTEETDRNLKYEFQPSEREALTVFNLTGSFASPIQNGTPFLIWEVTDDARVVAVTPDGGRYLGRLVYTKRDDATLHTTFSPYRGGAMPAPLAHLYLDPNALVAGPNEKIPAASGAVSETTIKTVEKKRKSLRKCELAAARKLDKALARAEVRVRGGGYQASVIRGKAEDRAYNQFSRAFARCDAKRKTIVAEMNKARKKYVASRQAAWKATQSLFHEK